MRPWWFRLFPFVAPHAPELGRVVLLMLLGVVLELLKPWPVKLLVDHALVRRPLPEAASWIPSLPGGGSDPGLVAWLAAATVLLFGLGWMLSAFQAYWQNGVGTRMAHALGGEVFAHLQRMSLRFHQQRTVGDLTRRVLTDSGCVRGLVIGAVLPILGSLVSLLAMFAVMWRLDAGLSLIALAVAPVMGLLIRAFDRPMTERTYQHQVVEGQVMALAEQTLSALPVVQAFGREAHHHAHFVDLSRRSLKAYLRTTIAQLQFKLGIDAVTAVGTGVVMVVGGLHVLDGTLTLGGLLVFLSYLVSLYAPMEVLAYSSSGLASAAAGARRVLEVLDQREEVAERPGARSIVRARGHVRLEDVEFGYERDRAVLRGVTLEARPGEMVALVGTTGSGKSTLVSLIARFYDPWSGRVLIDGADARDLKLADLRAQVSLVLQEPFLLPLSVAENIAYARPGATREEIERVARIANAHEFIERLPQGYETLLGERGSTLSGGQRQRISIARALLKDAPILILDEPTSALDAETESLLMEALERLTAGRTTFVIAHRLSTIRRADRIVSLHDGRLTDGVPPGMVAVWGGSPVLSPGPRGRRRPA